jgi:hypothetical protein
MKLPRHAEIWLLPYLKERWRRSVQDGKPKRVWLAITDHYEPLGLGVSVATALARVSRWREQWPLIASDAPRDADGQMPQYSFFYPQEEYRHDIVEGIAQIVRLGVGDMEVHLHHERETRDAFTRKIKEFCRQLTEDHGLLRKVNGRTVFGFIHGNWTLDNSHPEGKDCGLSGEIALLRDLGCYADFTMPSIPSPTQGRVINQIYWCANNPDNRPKSFDHGVRAKLGEGRHGDLLMITGPLGVRFGSRLIPRVESGEIAGYDMPTPARVKQWFDVSPRIGDDIFIKLYTHGAVERNLEPLLEDGLSNLYKWIAGEAMERNMEFRWASAWQMYKAVAALVGGCDPDPAHLSV